MKDLVDNDLNIGDNCYYIMNSKSGWSLSIIKIVEIKPSGIVCKFINCSLAEHQKNNYRGESYVGRLTKPLSNLKLIKVG